MHTAAWLVPAVIVVPSGFAHILGSAGNFCWLRGGRTSGLGWLRWPFYFVPLLLSLAYAVFVYCIVGGRLTRLRDPDRGPRFSYRGRPLSWHEMWLELPCCGGERASKTYPRVESAPPGSQGRDTTEAPRTTAERSAETAVAERAVRPPSSVEVDLQRRIRMLLLVWGCIAALQCAVRAAYATKHQTSVLLYVLDLCENAINPLQGFADAVVYMWSPLVFLRWREWRAKWCRLPWHREEVDESLRTSSRASGNNVYFQHYPAEPLLPSASPRASVGNVYALSPADPSSLPSSDRTPSSRASTGTLRASTGTLRASTGTIPSMP